jgi:hypothetical protein
MALQSVPSSHPAQHMPTPVPRPRPPADLAARLSAPPAPPVVPAAPSPAAPAAPAPEVAIRDVANAAADLLTPKEAGAILRVNHLRLERWRRKGIGPAFVKMNARTIAYRRADIDAFVAARLQPGAAS